MTEINRPLIETKLAAIGRFRSELERVLTGSYKAYIEDIRNVRMAERNIEMLVELAADTIVYLFTVRNLPPPDSYRETFLAANREGILPSELARKLADLASLRNRLIHEYDEKFDPLKAYEGFRAAPAALREFAEKIFAIL